LVNLGYSRRDELDAQQITDILIEQVDIESQVSDDLALEAELVHGGELRLQIRVGHDPFRVDRSGLQFLEDRIVGVVEQQSQAGHLVEVPE
jgi:hypothetical protein